MARLRYDGAMLRRFSVAAPVITLTLAGLVLAGLWQVGAQARQRELGILAQELHLALSRAASARPVNFDALFELRETLTNGDLHSLQSRLAAALPDYSDLTSRVLTQLQRQRPSLTCQVNAAASRLTLPEVGELVGAEPILIAGAQLQPGAISANHVYFLEANGMGLELTFTAACDNVADEVRARLLPLYLSIAALLVMLLTATVVTLRLTIYHRALRTFQSDLIDNLAHELHTPLTTLFVGLEALAPDGDKENLERLRRQVRRLQRIAERATAASRTMLHSTAPELSLFAADSEIQSLLAERFPEALSSGTVRLDLAAPTARLLADREDIEVLVGNLVDNGLKFSQPTPMVVISTKCQGSYLLLAVDDNGPGLGQMARPSRPFQRGDSTASGLGLGLHLCHRTARRLGGRLKLQPSDLGGTRAVVRLAIFREK